MRREARQLDALPLAHVEKLLASRWHEARPIALLVLVARYERGSRLEKEEIFRFYLAHSDRVNNWDLVDASAPGVVGAHVLPRSVSLLRRLARSKNVWERRIAGSSFLFVRVPSPSPESRLAR